MLNKPIISLALFILMLFSFTAENCFADYPPNDFLIDMTHYYQFGYWYVIPADDSGAVINNCSYYMQDYPTGCVVNIPWNQSFVSVSTNKTSGSVFIFYSKDGKTKPNLNWNKLTIVDYVYYPYTPSPFLSVRQDDNNYFTNNNLAIYQGIPNAIELLLQPQ